MEVDPPPKEDGCCKGGRGGGCCWRGGSGGGGGQDNDDDPTAEEEEVSVLPEERRCGTSVLYMYVFRDRSSTSRRNNGNVLPFVPSFLPSLSLAHLVSPD